jgi:HprK-related kinase A
MPDRQRVGDWPLSPFAAELAKGQLGIAIGNLSFRIRCALPDVAASLHRLYAEHPCEVNPAFSDFHAELREPRNLRRWLNPQVQFLVEGEMPFEPLPRDQAPAMLEWGLNWMLASSSQRWLNIHAASLERNGGVVMLPAPPGSGKSTLCAALALRGWRLLSDELTRLDPDTLLAHALARPINLKNASIDVIRRFQPDLTWAPDVYDTSRGRVTHLKPPVDSVRRMLEPATPRWIVFPRYVPDAEPLLTPRSKVATFNHFAQNAFNYSILGELGFRTVARLVGQCDCYDFSYSRLEDALEVFDWLLNPDD